MPRTNKITGRVFADLSKTPTQLGANERFLNLDEEMGLQVSKSLAAMKKKYKSLSGESEFVDVLDKLASIEEIIIQMRCKLVVESEIRLSLSRNYIYARSLFYRRGNEINDIRVIVGKTDDLGTDFDLINTRLLTDQAFLTLCSSKIREAMDKEIEKNVLNLNTVYANE
jgi:hypothetical protein